MSGVQTSADGPTDPKQSSNTTESDEHKDLTTGPIEPGADAKEIEAAKQRRFAAGDDTLQGDTPVNFGSAPVAK